MLLTCPKPFENLMFRLQSQRWEIPDFQTPATTDKLSIQVWSPANASRDEILPHRKPSPLTASNQTTSHCKGTPCFHGACGLELTADNDASYWRDHPCRSAGFLRHIRIRIWSLGCIGRGFRMGTESLSVVAATFVGAQKAVNLGIWNLEIWAPRDLEIWNQKITEKDKSQNTNPVCPKCSQGLG